MRLYTVPILPFPVRDPPALKSGCPESKTSLTPTGDSLHDNKKLYVRRSDSNFFFFQKNNFGRLSGSSSSSDIACSSGIFIRMLSVDAIACSSTLTSQLRDQ